ncbi:MAG: hypothetical protein N2652_05965 [Kiritimatiellae bacterium]|nr:hypothetical protein [Kiritimatiellia bacterium]
MAVFSLGYPEALERAWLRLAMRATGATSPEDACDRLARAAAELSDRFTTDREAGFGGYGRDARLTAAYGLFFFPRTHVRARLVLAECATVASETTWFRLRRPDVLIADIGAGTGAAGLAAVDIVRALRPRARCRLLACDQHAGALDRLVGLARELGSRRNPVVVRAPADATVWLPPEPVDIAIAGFSLNEMFETASDATVLEWMRRHIEQLRPGGWLVLLEPATRACAVRIERLRDALAVRDDLRILAPCPHHRPCPILALGRSNVWCHEVRRWNVPASLRWMNRRLHRDIGVLSYSFLAVERAPAPAASSDPSSGRLVGPVRHTGGRIQSWLCAADGSMRSCEVLTRHLERARTKRLLEQLERGARVRLIGAELIGDGRILRGRDFELASGPD